MDSTSLCFTHVNPQHLHGDYNISDHPQPAAIDNCSQSFLDQAPLNVCPFAQFGHSSLLDTPFVFPAEFSNAAGGSLFLTPSMPTSDLPILEDEPAQSTSTSVEEPISSIPESSFFAFPCYSSEDDDIFRQFQINNVPDFPIDVSEVCSHKQDPGTIVVSEFSNAVGDSLFLTPPFPTSDLSILEHEPAQSTSTSVEEPISSIPESSFFASHCHSFENDDIVRQFQINNVPDLSIDVSEVSSHKQDPDTSNVHLIEGITTTNKRKLTQPDLPPQKKTKGAPEVTVVKTEKTYTCPDCGRLFARLDNLKRHQEQKHLTKQELDKRGKLFKCPREGCRSQKTEYGFKTKQQLDIHMQKSCRFRPGGASSTS